MVQEDICFNKGGMIFNFRVACIIESNGRFLLHKKKSDSCWNLLGGRVKLGELCEDAIKREIREEIGCDVKVDRPIKICENFFRIKDTDFHEILVIYKVTLLSEIKEKFIEDNLAVKWFSKGELDSALIKPEFIKNILQEARYSIDWLVNDEMKRA